MKVILKADVKGKGKEGELIEVSAVSYTHLDVYKRQVQCDPVLFHTGAVLRQYRIIKAAVP